MLPVLGVLFLGKGPKHAVRDRFLRLEIAGREKGYRTQIVQTQHRKTPPWNVACSVPRLAGESPSLHGKEYSDDNVLKLRITNNPIRILSRCPLRHTRSASLPRNGRPAHQARQLTLTPPPPRNHRSWVGEGSGKASAQHMPTA